MVGRDHDVLHVRCSASDDEDCDATGHGRASGLECRPVARRWLMLFIYSCLACACDVLCFTFASVNRASKDFFHVSNYYTNNLVSVFFFTYIPLSFVSTFFMIRAGLRTAVVLGGALLAAGAWVRVAACYLPDPWPYWGVLAGQTVSALGAPFFSAAPPLLSANWFPERERTIATTIAVDATLLGVAVSFAAGPYIVVDATYIPTLLTVYAAVVSVAAFAAAALFESEPPVPPSHAAAKKAEDEGLVEVHWRDLLQVFRVRGFPTVVIGFAVSETCINTLPIILYQYLVPLGFPKGYVGWLGALFVVAGIVGSIIVGFLIRSADHFRWTLAIAFGASSAAMAVFTLCVGAALVDWITYSVAAVGFFIGAVEPVATELGVEVAYPAPEATVAAVQQLVGQLFCLLFLPLITILEDPTYFSGGGAAAWLLTGLLAFGLPAFVFFNGETRRADLEKEHLLASHHSAAGPEEGYGTAQPQRLPGLYPPKDVIGAEAGSQTVAA
eukprot:tig00021373_g21081.t1